jgi:hypothetical protein
MRHDENKVLFIRQHYSIRTVRVSTSVCLQGGHLLCLSHVVVYRYANKLCAIELRQQVRRHLDNHWSRLGVVLDPRAHVDPSGVVRDVEVLNRGHQDDGVGEVSEHVITCEATQSALFAVIRRVGETELIKYFAFLKFVKSP